MPRTAKKEPPLQTREKMLLAGTKIFALYGYEGASTRQLAKEAGVNISAILYHFNGKEGYYAAVLEHIAAMAMQEMSGRAMTIRAALAKKDLSAAECRELMHMFMEGLIGFLLSDKASAHMGRIFIREQMDPTPAFDKLYNATIRPMHETVTQLVTKMTGLEGAEAACCVQSLMGQGVVFKTHREVVLRRTGWKTYGDKETKTILALLRRHTDAILDSYQKKGRTP